MHQAIVARAPGIVRTSARMTGADWIWSLAALCETTGQSIYLLGSEPGIARWMLQATDGATLKS